MGAKQPLVQVGVFDHEGKHLETARVCLEPEETGRKAYPLRWDRSRGCHLARGVAGGRYRLIAQALGHEPVERRVEVEVAGLRTVILLAPAGLPFLYRGQVRTPFQPQPDRFAIALDETMSKDAVTKLHEAAEQEGLVSEFVDVNSNWQPPRHARVFRFPFGSSATSRREIVGKLVAMAGVHQLGPLVHFDKGESISCLTDELVVRFQPEVNRTQIDELAGRRKLTTLRQLVVAGNMFVFRMPGPVAYEMLDVANETARSDLVVYAEPNLISIGIHDAIGGGTHCGAVEPTDFLFPMQWHLPLMRCPQAWQLIGDTISPHRAMGNPQITIAVVDWGIDVENPEFAGNLANGQPKVSAVFDFHNMAASNGGRSHGHGTCCAGVATASPDNGGGCGVAGNCRLMAIRRPEGIMASETAYSDMYLWIAGFDPQSPTTGFPQPIGRGADVISNSFGYAAGLPISGLMRDTFDLLAERGRNGRGILMFFSTGNNYPPVDFTLLRPWAAHERTCAVGASTLAPGGMAETRAKQSNFGGAAVLDFCAPSATALGDPYDPPRTYAVVTAADGASSDPDPNLQPNAPSDCRFRTTTST
jgi:Subtilase family